MMMKNLCFFLIIVFTLLSAAAACPAEEIRAGDIVVFGQFEQDNDPENGPEPVEWQVLAVEDGRALVISRYVIDSQPFHESWDDVNWETCSLRGWLNEAFFGSVFSEEEQNRIGSVTIQNPDTSIHELVTGEARIDGETADRIFLLSLEEAHTYFADDSERICEGTAYETAKERYASGSNTAWWLRSRADQPTYSIFVGSSGAISRAGSKVVHSCGVRPAFWLTISR